MIAKESYVSVVSPRALGLAIGVLVVGAGRDKRSTATITGGTGKEARISNVGAVGDEEFRPEHKARPSPTGPDRIFKRRAFRICGGDG